MALDLNDLPELALIQVFKHLRLYDQLNARLVCKKWKVLIEEIDLSSPRTELVLFVQVMERPLFWSYNHQPVNLNSSIGVDPSKIPNSSSSKRLFRSVKRLYIALFEESPDFLTDVISSFSNLEHLEIYNPIYRSLQSACHFSFGESTKIDLKSQPKLRTLHLVCTYRLVNLPCSLTDLSVFDDFQWQENFRNLKSLRWLKVRSFSVPPNCELPNLEVLFFSLNLEFNLEAFEKLKEVHYCCDYERQGISLNIRKILAALFERKVSLRRELDIYYDGIRCRSLEEIKNTSKHQWIVNAIGKEEFELLLEGSDIGSDYVKKTFLFNETTFDEYKDQLSANALEKLARAINFLVIGNGLEAHRLESFSFRDIHRQLDGKVKPLLKYAQMAQLSALPQELLDELPDLMPSLLVLYSINGYKFKCKTLNFTFLKKFKGLKQLHVERDWLSIDLLEVILNQCKFLDLIVIRTDQCRDTVFISKKQVDKYSIAFNFAFPPPKERRRGPLLSSKTELLNLV